MAKGTATVVGVLLILAAIGLAILGFILIPFVSIMGDQDQPSIRHTGFGIGALGVLLAVLGVSTIARANHPATPLGGGQARSSGQFETLVLAKNNPSNLRKLYLFSLVTVASAVAYWYWQTATHHTVIVAGINLLSLARLALAVGLILLIMSRRPLMNKTGY